MILIKRLGRMRINNRKRLEYCSLRKVEETPLYDLFNTDIFEIEIIGNIHTNSELAEVEQ